jgi:hypothetical protein
MFFFKRKNSKNHGSKEETIAQASVGNQAQCYESSQQGKKHYSLLFKFESASPLRVTPSRKKVLRRRW